MNRSFKQRESNLKNFIDLLNEINENKSSNNYAIDNLIFVDCFPDAQSSHEYLFHNIKFDLKIKECNYRGRDSFNNFLKDLNDLKSLFLNNGFQSLSNCLLIVNENYSHMLKKSIMFDGFSLWNDNKQQLIVGAQAYGFNNSRNKFCYEMSYLNISRENYKFVSLNYGFVHR